MPKVVQYYIIYKIIQIHLGIKNKCKINIIIQYNRYIIYDVVKCQKLYNYIIHLGIGTN